MISSKDIRHLAWLAKIELSRADERLFQKQLGDILDYFKQIDEADTKDVEPTLHVLDITNAWRPDEPRPSIPVDKALSNAKRTKDKFIVAPKMV